MQNNPGKERKTFFEPLSPPVTPKIDPKILPILYRKRRNASPEKPPDDTINLEGLDPETCEIFTRFLTSQGLPLEAVKENSFRIVFNYLNVKKVIPTPAILRTYVEKMGNPKKHSQALSKATGPLSVTIDVIKKENGDNYFTFSIHFFEGFEERKCLINLKKLLISEIEAKNILTVVRRAISILNQDQVKISNFVVSNERMFEMFKPYDTIIKHQFISFHHLIEKFAGSILNIEIFSKGIEKLREFVLYVKTTPSAYAKFRRAQLAADESVDFPDLDDQNCWYSTTTFLFKCLNLHRRFSILAERCNISYISIASFGELSVLYKVLQQCAKHARDLSGEQNSISQIIPAVTSIRNYIFLNLSHGYTYETDIRKEFFYAFKNLTCGPMSRKYDLATLLDPRFAYDESIYPDSRWSAIEKAVKEELVNKSDSQTNREFVNSTREAKIQKVHGELDAYTIMCIESRPNANESPFQWWNSQKDNLENLVLIAREYLACPAVSIDAQQFFGSGGKFSNLVEIYNSKSLESYLNCAGHHQQFLGHGSNIEHISGLNIIKLNVAVPRTRCLLADPEGIVSPKAMNIRDKIPRRRILEIDPEDVKLEDLDSEDTLKDSMEPRDPIEKEIKSEPLDPEEHTDPVDPMEKEGSKDLIIPIQSENKPMDAYAQIEKEHNYHKSIGATRKKWALGQPMTVLKAVKPPPTESMESLMNPKEAEPSNDEPMENKPDIEHTIEDPQESKLEKDDYMEKEPIQTTSTKWALGKPMAILTSSSPNQLLKCPEDLSEDVFEKEVNAMSLDDNYKLMREELDESWSPTFKEWALGGSLGIPFLEREELEKPRRRPCNRSCVMCEVVRLRISLKSVTIENEKLFLLLGAVLGNRLNVSQANTKYFRSQTHSYYCLRHFQESCLEIFKELGVNGPVDIVDCVELQFENIWKLILMIRNVPAEYKEIKELLTSLTNRYFIRPEILPVLSPSNSQKIVQDEVQEIIPKEERVPRKQTLEKDAETTVRIIKTVPFVFPDYSNENTKETGGSVDEMRKCCFCLITTSRVEMTKAPKSSMYIQKWIDKLGEDFAKRLDINGENYICRSHFSPNAFSRRRRLLKGMMPETEVVRTEVTYQIDGDNFWKIEEPEEVDAPTSSLKIDDGQVTGETSDDVATSKSCGRPRGRPKKGSRLEIPPYEKPEAIEFSEDVHYYEESEYTDSSEDEGSEHSEYNPDEDYDYIKAPPRSVGRPRKYPKIEKEDVEEDSEDEQICRFCSEVVDKTEAYKGSKNRIRLSEWNKYLGVDFVRNLDYRDNNYVCKKHFRMISCEQSSSLGS